MSNLRFRKRGSYWEYSFEAARISGKRQTISKSGFRTKGEASAAGAKAMAEYNISFSDEYLLVGDYSSERAYKVMKEFLNKHKEVTAIFSISDIMAIGIAKAIAEEGYEIGKDISLIGFDGMDISKFYNPGIATVEQPKKLMAEKSVELLMKLLKNEGENDHIILDTKLLKRDSCQIVKGR